MNRVKSLALAAVTVALVVVALAGCSATHHEAGSKHSSAPPSILPSDSPSATPTVQGYPEAAARYVAILVPLNNIVNNENALGDESGSEFIANAPFTRDAFYKAAQQLGSPTSWPQPVQAAITKLKAALVASGRVMDAVGRARSDSQVQKALVPMNQASDDRDAAAAFIYQVLGVSNEDAVLY